jgi:hypothetical protein
MNAHINIHASNGGQTYDPSIRMDETNSWRRGDCGRPTRFITVFKRAEQATGPQTEPDQSFIAAAVKASNLTLLSSMGRGGGGERINKFDEATVGQLYINGNRHDTGDNRSMRLSSPSVVRYILTAKQGDSQSFILTIEVVCSSETPVLKRTTRRGDIQKTTSLR